MNNVIFTCDKLYYSQYVIWAGSELIKYILQDIYLGKEIYFEVIRQNCKRHKVNKRGCCP